MLATSEIAQFTLGDLTFKIHTPHFLYPVSENFSGFLSTFSFFVNIAHPGLCQQV
jgi:hypothetical protein